MATSIPVRPARDDRRYAALRSSPRNTTPMINIVTTIWTQSTFKAPFFSGPQTPASPARSRRAWPSAMTPGFESDSRGHGACRIDQGASTGQTLMTVFLMAVKKFHSQAYIIVAQLSRVKPVR